MSLRELGASQTLEHIWHLHVHVLRDRDSAVTVFDDSDDEMSVEDIEPSKRLARYMSTLM